LFHNSKVFSSCIIQILYTGCAKIKKNNSGTKRLNAHGHNFWRIFFYIGIINNVFNHVISSWNNALGNIWRKEIFISYICSIVLFIRKG